MEEWKRCSGYYKVHEDEDDAVSVASEELYRPRTPEAQLVTITDKPSRDTFFPEMVLVCSFYTLFALVVHYASCPLVLISDE